MEQSRILLTAALDQVERSTEHGAWQLPGAQCHPGAEQRLGFGVRKGIQKTSVSSPKLLAYAGCQLPQLSGHQLLQLSKLTMFQGHIGADVLQKEATVPLAETFTTRC